MTDYTRATEQPGEAAGEARGPAHIESEIRRTRDRMGEEMEAIGEKLRPERIKQRAKDAVSRKTRETSAGLVRTARENPVPAAMVAVGMTMLLRARKQRDAGNGHSTEAWSGGSSGGGVTDRAQEMVGEGREKVGQVAGKAAERAKRTGSDLRRFFQSSPIIAGAAAMVLGAAIGALLPETEKENRLMGQARDDLVEQAKGVAEHAKGELEEKMSESQPSRPSPSSPSSPQPRV